MKRTMNKLILIMPALIVLILAQAFAPVTAGSSCYPPLANMIITQLTNSYGVAPQINNNGHVVWEGYVGSDLEIFLYNGTSIIQLTDNSYEDGCPQINDNGYVVWTGYDGSDYEIFLYNGITTTQLTNNSYEDGCPLINNNGYVVWQGRPDGLDREIFLYDGLGVTQLTDNSYDDRDPQINNNGYVVWQGSDGSDQEIFLYDGTSITQLTNNSYDDRDPQINNNGYVVWMGYDGSDYEIFLYNGITTTQLTNNSYDDNYPQINDNGYIVWLAYGEVFLYDGTTITNISNCDGWFAYSPQINDKGFVVWEEDDRIFLYDGMTTTQITDTIYPPFSTYCYSPQINDKGYVVWQGGPPLCSEWGGCWVPNPNIFLAKPLEITVTPTSHNFGNILVGSSSAAQTFTISSTGTTDLVIGKITLTGTYASEFSTLNDNCSGQTLAPSGNCTVQVVFSPTHPGGTKSVNLSIPSSAQTFNVPLTGASVPIISVTPESYNFGNVQIGSSSAAQTFTISSTGTADLIIRTIILTGTDTLQFRTLNDSCSGQTLAPSNSCTIEAVFLPTSAGAKNANLYIPSDAPTVIVPLSGASVPVCQCNLVPDATVIPRGGTLGLQASVTNNTNEVQVFKFATRITKPSGGKYPATGYLKGPLTVNLGPHGSMSRHLSQYIPNTAPLGTYTYHGYVGVPGNIYDGCQFNFTVTQ